MRLAARIRREIGFLRDLNRTLSRVKSISKASPNLSCDDFEAAVAEHTGRPAITFEGTTLTFGEFDQLANRYASWARSQNIRRGATVALVMPNRIDYAAIWLGLSKIGVVTALINNQLSGGVLTHCLKLSGAKHILVDDETEAAAEAVRESLDHPIIWTLARARGDHRDLSMALRSASSLAPDRATREGLTAADTALLIFTSGTTGLPKAARITHSRLQLYMRGFAGATDARPTDSVYVTLPLYHATGGLCGVGAAWLNGARVVLKRRFSASQFWDDIRAEGCTMFVYIGELCRYLVNQPPSADDRDHKIRKIFGNGLRADVWREMLDRFAVGEVLEFYGSTEGNVSIFNFDGKVGAIGRLPKYLRKAFNVRVIRFDMETEQPVRGPDGLCQETTDEEIGECVGQITDAARFSYTGYADKQASEKKILRDVFEKGDAFFATGDLMRRDSEGYLYFVDRVGDTYRWKGENVSTGEVAVALSAYPGVKEANVYGVSVPHAEGRAGMALLVVSPEFDIAGLGAHLDQVLPAYARPILVRLAPQIETTGTFNYRKVDLVQAGYDPTLTKAPTFFRAPGKGFIRVTQVTLGKLRDGSYRL